MVKLQEEIASESQERQQREQVSQTFIEETIEKLKEISIIWFKIAPT